MAMLIKKIALTTGFKKFIANTRLLLNANRKGYSKSFLFNSNGFGIYGMRETVHQLHWNIQCYQYF